MKKILIAPVFILSGVTLLAQGTVIFNNRVVGSVITHVYVVNGGLLPQIGNGSNDTPSGTTDWAGYTLLSGSRYFAQLIGGPQGTPEASLVPESPATTFRTGGAAGWVAGVVATIAGVPADSSATVEMVAWDNSSGLYNTWAQAFDAWQNGLIFAGRSNLINIGPLGGGVTLPPNLVGLQSFSIGVPEPSPFALAGLGTSLLLLSRRAGKKTAITPVKE